ncbi:sensor domain-containing diguanylate cyclase [Neptuniibacter marinus]|uniref:sensor domain-containing diguanylate cyclase n=1 Tax=Neptuniibacter marinus TaxID=1806670 RepID=UPI00082CDB22|nr:sensor domain-containing diguanylate cyclase [Neptuniibacter marinus]
MLTPDQWVLDESEGSVPLAKWQKTIDVMARVFNAPAGFIVQYAPEGFQVVISSGQASNPYDAGVTVPQDTNLFCKKVVEQQELLYVPDASTDPYWNTNPEVSDDGFCSYLGLPVKWPTGEPFGTICVMDFNATNYQKDYVDLVSELRDLIEADLKILSQYQMISNLAMTDELTGLYNRRGFYSVAQQYIALAKRSKLSLGLLYMDMDGLKRVNDVYGHLAGDQALRRLGKALEETVRESDVAARLSGDEFVMLVAIRNLEQLTQIAERVVDRITKDDIRVSIGSVLMDDSAQTLEYWIGEADRRMYENKNA